jgi:KDO2-lipid IV(A) palmitoleoyltransferase
MDDELREAMIEKNFMSLGMALFETGYGLVLA